MSRARPSKAELAAAMRHWSALHDVEPPGDGRGAAAVQPVTTPSTTDEGNVKSTTARAAALEDFRQAKLLYNAAVLAAMAGLPFATEQVSDALTALNQARAELAQIDGSVP